MNSPMTFPGAVVRAVIFALFALFAACGQPSGPAAESSADRELRELTIAANPAGTHSFTVAGGLARVLQERRGVRATIRPFSGSSVYLPMLQRGELALKVLDYSEDGGLILSGTGAPGATLRVYLDNALLGDVQIGENGAWTFRTGGGPVPPGLHRLRLDQLDAGGNVIGRIEEPFRQADPETIANLKPGEVIVQPGNSLWRISRRIYGKGIDYTVIYLANAGQIRDPDLIYPGQVFTIPQR